MEMSVIAIHYYTLPIFTDILHMSEILMQHHAADRWNRL